MKGPGLVCAGCNQAATLNKPVCDDCLRQAGIEPLPPCVWCERGCARDRWGSHVNPTGGYVGKCTRPLPAVASSPPSIAGDGA